MWLGGCTKLPATLPTPPSLFPSECCSSRSVALCSRSFDSGIGTYCGSVLPPTSWRQPSPTLFLFGDSTDMSINTLLLSESGGVATITFNRPEKRNAVSFELVDELLQI